MDLFDSSTWGGGISDLLLQPEVTYTGGDPMSFTPQYASWNFVNPPQPLLDIDLAFTSTFTAEFTGLLTGSMFIVSDGNRQVVLEELGGKYYFDGDEVAMPSPESSHFVFRVISTGDRVDLYVAQSEPGQTGIQLVASIVEMTAATSYAAGMHFTGQSGTFSQIAGDSQPVLPKRVPIAFVDGPSTSVPSNQAVGLSGERSYDPDGYEISFLWEISGPVPVRTSDSTYASAEVGPALFTSVEPGAAGNGIIVEFLAADPTKEGVLLDYDSATKVMEVTPGSLVTPATWFDLLQQMEADLLTAIITLVIEEGSEGDSLPTSGGATLFGGSDSSRSILSFSSPVPGVYDVTLRVYVRDGNVLVQSAPARFEINVIGSTLLADQVPDGHRFWDLIPEDFYRLLENPKVFETFWSGLIQAYGSVLHDVWVEDQRSNLQLIEDRISRRWLPYPTQVLVEQPIEQASESRKLYGTVRTGGDVYLSAKGSADNSVASATVLSDATVDFVALGVAFQVLVTNVTDGSTGIVTSFDETTVTCAAGLSGGLNNLWQNSDEYAVELRFPQGFRLVYVEEQETLHEVLRAPSGVAVMSPPVPDRREVTSGIYGRVDTGFTFYPTFGTIAFTDAEISAGTAFVTLSGVPYLVLARNGDGFDLDGSPPPDRDYSWTAYVTLLDDVTMQLLSHVSFSAIATHQDILETTEGDEYTVYGLINGFIGFDAARIGTTKRVRYRTKLAGYEDLVSIPKIKPIIAWNEVRLATGRKGTFSQYSTPTGVWTKFSAPNLPTDLDPLERYELRVGERSYVADVSTASPDLLIYEQLPEQPGVEWRLYRILAYTEYRDYVVEDNRVVFHEPHDFPQLLWAEMSWFDDTQRVRHSFGDIAGIQPEDVEGFSGGYADAVRAVFYGLMNDSFTENIANAVSLLVGVPVSFEEGTVTTIDLDFTPDTSRIEVTGDTTRVYLFPRGVNLAENSLTGEVYEVNDPVHRFARLTEGVQVLDWVNAPVRFASLIASGLLHPFQERHYFEVHVDGQNFQNFDWAVQGAIIGRLHPSHKWYRLIADIFIDDTLSITDYCLQNITMSIIEDMHTDTQQVNQGQYAVMSDSYDGRGQSQLHGVQDNGLDAHNRPIIPEYPNADRYVITVKDTEVVYQGTPDEGLMSVLAGLDTEITAAAIPGVTTVIVGGVLTVTWNNGSAIVDSRILNWWHTEYQFGPEEGDPLSGPHGVSGRLEMSGWEDFVEPWLVWHFNEGDIPRADMGLFADSVDENGMPDDERGLFFWADEPLMTKYAVTGSIIHADPNADLLNGWFVVYPYAGFVWDNTPRQVFRPYADQHIVVEKQYVDGVFIEPPYEATSPHYEFSLMNGSPTTMELDGGAGTVPSGSTPVEDEKNAIFTELSQDQRFRFGGDSGYVRQLFVKPWFRNSPISVVTAHNLGSISDGGTFQIDGRYFSDGVRVFFGDLEATGVAVNHPFSASHSSMAVGGGALYIDLDPAASAVDGFYDHWVVEITGGTGAGQSRVVSDYSGSTKRAGVTFPWVTPPDATSAFQVRNYSNPDYVSGTVPNGPVGSVVDVKLLYRGKHRTLSEAYTHT